MNRPLFSGHESFQCKTHWLKRGYDFVSDQNNKFTDDDAVVKLGVGKNMVASIKFWMRAFGMLSGESSNMHLTDIADYLFKDDVGVDPYLEDLGTLWLLHFMLIHEDYASIYKLTFVDYHKQYNVIEKQKLQNFVKFVLMNNHLQNLYNENTVKRDIGVLLHNYCGSNSSNIEDKNTLLLPLNLIGLKEVEEVSEKNRVVFAFNNAISIKVLPQSPIFV